MRGKVNSTGVRCQGDAREVLPRCDVCEEIEEIRQAVVTEQCVRIGAVEGTVMLRLSVDRQAASGTERGRSCRSPAWPRPVDCRDPEDSAAMIVLDELGDDVPEVPLTDWNDAIETFFLDRPDESLRRTSHEHGRHT